MKINVKKAKRIGLFLFLTILGIVLLYPFIYSILGSVSTNEEYLYSTLLPFPKQAFSHLKNYLVIFASERLPRSLLITLFKIIWLYVTSLFTALLGGYAFAKLKFPYKKPMFIVLVGSMMIPGVALFVPNYIWMANFPLLGGNNLFGEGGSGFVNNPIAMICLLGWVNSGNLYLFKQAFMGMGNELKEAAQIDGANLFQIVFEIYAPLLKPLAAVFLLNTFIGVWGDYMGNLIYLPAKTDWWTIGTVVVSLMDDFTNTARYGGVDYPKAFAVAVVSMLPPILIYAGLQKNVTEGLAMGSVKG